MPINSNLGYSIPQTWFSRDDAKPMRDLMPDLESVAAGYLGVLKRFRDLVCLAGLWGGQLCPQPPFQAASSGKSWASLTPDAG